MQLTGQWRLSRQRQRSRHCNCSGKSQHSHFKHNFHCKSCRWWCPLFNAGAWPGWQVRPSPTPTEATNAGRQGNYTITVPYNWSGTVTPSKPVTHSHLSTTPTPTCSANQTAQNYTATADTYTISGNAGWQAQPSPTPTARRPPDGTGNLHLHRLLQLVWHGHAFPGRIHIHPGQVHLHQCAANQRSKLHRHSHHLHHLGQRGGGRRDPQLHRWNAKTATADGSGDYTFTVSYNWSGMVTPSLAGYTFTPGNTSYTNVTANQTSKYSRHR